VDFTVHYPKHDKALAVNTKLGIDVYRIVQEAVNNAIKHAKANNITVDVKPSKNFLDVQIIDDGHGFSDTNKQQGYGIASMQNRAEKMAGSLSLQSMQPCTKVALRVQLS